MFLYTQLLQRALADIAGCVPWMRHIEPARVLLVSSSRVASSCYGNIAQCFGLPAGEKLNCGYWYHRPTRRVVRMTPWVRHASAQVLIGGRCMAYVILVRLPRMLENGPLDTLVHEMVHIAPAFDGHLRRLRHGNKFNAMVRETCEYWLRQGNPEIVEMMQLSAEQVEERWHSLAGMSFAPPFVTPQTRLADESVQQREHPDFHSKNLLFDLPTVERVAAQLTDEKAPEVLTENDLVCRVYHAQGSRVVPHGMLVRALRSARAPQWQSESVSTQFAVI